MAVPEFADTILRCRDGLAYGERSFFRRLRQDFAECLRCKSGELYELPFPRESVRTLQAVAEYLQYLFENFGLKGPDSRNPREHDPPLAAADRAAVVDFFCRHELAIMADPFFEKLTDAEEAELLWEAVRDNEEMQNLADLREQVELGLLTGILLYGREEHPPLLKLTLESYQTAWRLLQNLAGNHQPEKAQEYYQAFWRVFAASGYEAAELQGCGTEEIFPADP